MVRDGLSKFPPESDEFRKHIGEKLCQFHTPNYISQDFFCFLFFFFLIQHALEEHIRSYIGLVHLLIASNFICSNECKEHCFNKHSMNKTY